ncbi:hypothetical protein ACLOJK_014435 [Asimina triloba]
MDGVDGMSRLHEEREILTTRQRGEKLFTNFPPQSLCVRHRSHLLVHFHFLGSEHNAREEKGERMASSKTIIDLFQPAAKRLKSLPVSETTISKTIVSCCKSSSSDSAAEAILTVEQKSRIEFNRFLASSKRNLRICKERVENAKGGLFPADGMGYARLEELLVEESWLGAVPGELQKPYAKNLCKFVGQEVRGSLPIYPPQFLTFNALNSTPFDRVKAVILGQDPYHGPGQAMGLAFSVPAGVKIPSSLVNIFKELKQDVGCSIPNNGTLERWAVQVDT